MSARGVFLSLGIKRALRQEARGAWYIRWVLSGCTGKEWWKPVLELTSKAGTGLLGKASRI